MTNLFKGPNIIRGLSRSPGEGISTIISAVIGNFKKGPTDEPILVSNWADFVNKCGDEPIGTSTGWHSVKGFYSQVAEAPLYIIRIVGPSAAAASTTIQDRDGTPENTLKVEGANVGDWAEKIEVQTTDYNILSTTLASAVTAAVSTSATLKSVGGLQVGSFVEFDNSTNQEIVQIEGIDTVNKTISWTGTLTYSYAIGDSAKSKEFALIVYWQTEEVERWEGLSMIDTCSNFCETVINGVSSYIKVTDQDSTTTGFDQTPKVQAKTFLTGGDDDLANVEKTHYVGSVGPPATGMYMLNDINGLFRVSCPNPTLTDADPAAAYLELVQELLTFCDNALPNVSLFQEIPASKTVAQAVTFAENYEGRNLSLWYPWGSVKYNGVWKDIPLSAHVMGAAVRKDFDEGGAHVSVGGKTIGYCTKLETQITRSQSETLNDAGISTVEKMSVGGIQTNGARNRSAETAFRFIAQSEYDNYLVGSIIAAMNPFRFKPITPGLMGQIRTTLTGLLKRETTKGALFDMSAPEEDPFLVLCSPNDGYNSGETAALGQVWAYVEYCKVGEAEKIAIILKASPAGIERS